jgi:16S rRNA C967 or C1407 C5-methylase (RsmB/RsmF family)/NOL1/NOP2/fmu family ribosome biogenesis protein
MQLPAAFLTSLESVNGFDKDAFLKVHASGEQVTSIRLNPRKPLSQIPNSQFPIPWTQYGFYLKERPSFTFDPLFHAGCYYVQEASSMFLEQVLKQTVDLSKPIKILDLCAAPGGKSTHIQSLITQESLLVSNEVIKSRNNILKDNIIKWGCENVVVTNNDPKDFARLENYFDVIVVDAPCSGSGLFRKEPEAIDHWSENNVQLCSQRQQRILADVLPALKKDGVLIYSTCSYSKEEDEDIAEWLVEEFKIEDCRLQIDRSLQIVKSLPGYRFWPYKILGEGFFIAVFKKTEGGEPEKRRAIKNLMEVSKKEIEFVKQFCIVTDELAFVNGFDGVYAVNKYLLNDMNFLNSNLRVSYFGVKAGELMRNKMIPAHALAMSHLISDSVPRILLNTDQAIQYLQKKDFNVETNTKGWQLICFENHPLGWVNMLPNRVNNYYPKELRILKER